MEAVPTPKGSLGTPGSKSDYLLRLSALALSFVGFSAIVVALRRALGGELSDRHVALVRLFIEGGLAVAALGLLPTLLSLMSVGESSVWRMSSAGAATVFAIYFTTQFRRRRRVESGRPPIRVFVNYSISITVFGTLCLNAVGFPYEPNVGPYGLALTWLLILAGLVFLQTIEVFLHLPPHR